MFMKHGDSGCAWFDQKGIITALDHGVLCINNLNKDYSVGSPINAVTKCLKMSFACTIENNINIFILKWKGYINYEQ